MAPHVGDAAPVAHVSEPVVKGEAKDGTSHDNTQGTYEDSYHYEDGSHGSGFSEWVQKLIWRGGSKYDAWLNAASAQVGQVILTLPTAMAQMGFALGLVTQFAFAALGCWTAYLLSALYAEHRVRGERARGPKAFQGHVIQYHEIAGSLVGPWARWAVVVFNLLSLGGLTVVQIIACASDMYYLSSVLSKRSWALVFGGMSLLTVLLPTFHNYRVWSFLGLVATTYTSWLMVGESLHVGQAPGVKHRGPHDITSFFSGLTTVLFAYGGHSITIEILHAMWHPRKYPLTYVTAVAYVFTLTVPNSVSVYWAYGDQVLKKSNAFGVLPPSPQRNVGIILMVLHQGVAFGLFVTPLYFLWEKLLGTHQASYIVRVSSRIPVVLVIWFLAVAFPFFGPINSILGALTTTFATYLLPVALHWITFRTSEARANAVIKPPRWLGRNWNVAFLISGVTFLTVAILGVGFGGYASIHTLIDQISTFGVFDECYQCPAPPKPKRF